MLTPGSVVFDARNFVQFWFEGRLVTESIKATASNPNSFGAMFLDYEQILRQHFFNNPDLKKAKGLSKDSLMFAFSEYLFQASSKALGQHIQSFNCETEDLNPLRSWVSAVTGRCTDEDLAVMAQWMWMVKRKGNGKLVRYHIMPVVFGPQGAGKSEALKALFRPMEEFRLNLPMNDIGDPRLFETMSVNLVVFYDELSGIQRTDLNALKNQITTDVNSYRKLNTHISVTVPMACSFIAASNKRLDEQFSDSTGARRFYELEAAQKIDWDVINKTDYTAMWKGIDEKNSVGYLTGDALVKVTTIQRRLITAEDIEMYMDDRNYKGEPTRVITAIQAYRDYRQWCVDSGVPHVLSLGWFVKKLKNRGIESYTERDENRNQHRYFKVSEDCTVITSKSLFVAQSAALKWS